MSYVLTGEAMKRLVSILINEECDATDPINEDLNVGYCLQNDVLQIDTRDEFKAHRFFPIFISQVIGYDEIPDYWFWEYNYYDTKWNFECCSETFIGAHYSDIEYQYLLKFLIHNMTVFLNNKYDKVLELPKKKSLVDMLLESIEIRV